MPTVDTDTTPDPIQISIIVEFDIQPAVPEFGSEDLATSATLQVVPLPIHMEEAITAVAKDVTAGYIASYYDQSRELKTVANFGDDYQTLLTNWMRDPNNLSNHGLLLKLYQPLPVNVDIKTLLWISREVSPTLLDQISILITPEQEIILFLRPPNRNIKIGNLAGIEINNLSLTDLISTGSAIVSGTQIITDNPILEKWYTINDFEGVKLNVDYTDYNNFISFGSAAYRLSGFRQKLIQIENSDSALNSQALAASASLVSSSLNDVSGTVQYDTIVALSEQRQDIIRGFDGYERFLYYESASFSGSLSGLTEDAVIYIDDVCWPKENGSVLPITSSTAIAYYNSQFGIASDYDNNNPEWLVLNIPEYVRDDAESLEFLTFLSMVGHYFDVVKLYIKQMPFIYDRNANPKTGLAPELLWHIGKSLGIELPNQYAIKNLVDYTVGQASATQDTYDQAISETWKRFLHNQIYVAKTKGTKTGLLALRNTYGVLPQLVRLKEAVTPSPIFATGSFELFDELTSVLRFESGSTIEVPFSESFDVVQIRFRSTIFVSGTIVEAIDSGSNTIWRVVSQPTGSEVNGRGVLELRDGSDSVLLTTDVGRFYTGDYFNMMVRRNSPTDFDWTVKNYDEGVFTYEYGPTTVAVGSSITGSVETIYVGGFNYTSYSGSVDEFRIWDEVTTDATFDNQTKFPGLYAGNATASAKDSLDVRLSFNKPIDFTLPWPTSSIPNETPFNYPANLSEFSASGFSANTTWPYNYEWIVRQTQRFSANAGGSQYSSNNITIAPPAEYKPGTTQVTGSTVIPVLSKNRRIRAAPSGSQTTLKDSVIGNSKVGFYLTLAETINDSILRSMGNVDLNQLIGDPQNLYNAKYDDLISTYEYYRNTYAPIFDYNKFIRFTEGLLDGLFNQAQQNIPVPTKMITGIVIEPPILERNKIILNKPLIIEGKNTKRDDVARTILATEGRYPDSRTAEADVEGLLSPDPLGDITLLNVDIEDQPIEDVVVLLDLLETDVAGITAEDVLANITLLEPTIDLEHFASLIASVPTYDALIDVDIVYTISSSAEFVFDEILAESDLTDPSSNTYFMHQSGSFGLVNYQKVRRNDSRLTDTGDWVRETVYQANDVAVVSESQYRCLTSKVTTAAGAIVNFTSYISPELDTANWTNVTFIQVPQLLLFKAIVSGSSPIGAGNVSLVPFDPSGGEQVFTGYAPNHFKFFRNKSRGWINARYIGSLQTADTTTDGKSPVEVLPSSEAQLFVKEGKPIQTDTDEGGPILDVR